MISRPPTLALLVLLAVATASTGRAASPDLPVAANPAAELLAEVSVDGDGILLPQVANPIPGARLPAIKLGDAPGVGVAVVLSRKDIDDRLRRLAPHLSLPAWSGSQQVKVTRKAKDLEEPELLSLLTGAVQRDLVREAGEVELKLTRPWMKLRVPDEPLQLRLADAPPGGVSANQSLRFELLAKDQLLGTFQTFARVRIMHEILVAQRNLRRGDELRESDFTRERRDVLQNRDGLTELPAGESGLELVEGISAGAPLRMRALRLRPVVCRGGVVDALVQDGMLSIALKVEVLENGAPGQTVRVRNPITRREFKGKVRDEQTVLVTL